MAGSAAQRELQMSMVPVPTPFDDTFQPPTSSVDLPGLIHQPDINSIAGWASMLIDGAQNPAFEPKLVVLSRGTEWPGVVFNATSTVTATGYLGSRRNGVKRWEIELGSPETELGGNSGTNFLIDRFDDAGNVIAPSPLAISRATGVVTFGAGMALAALPPQAANSAAAAALGVPIGGFYRNGDALMVRTV